ncbi:Carboxymuconolactone decarboxylase family protein [Natronorubrum sediminis]|uniref:Carboxymuconolactone decarboxylase family protein n=1 Tax=Natronorubrum sediminis TaxID=640943 RepID=A0A1H6G5T5_9EURY|nr:carboxymuconolactone decarboxylase family protein [Natronorubrum sediminis]SEH17818.1 Carboxymuconolactone decarboxylase family protein [Natronorubrum sediminis]
MVRVPYVNRDDLPAEKRDLLRSFRAETPEEYRHLLSSEERNVYRTLAHVPNSLEQFRAFGGTLREELGLDPRERELVILTAANALGSAYEWHQHVRIGLAEGLSREEILAISDRRYESFEGTERALVEYVDAYVAGSVDDETFGVLSERVNESKIVGIGLLAGMYIVIGRQMDALEVETEEPFVGWELENIDP